MIVHCERPNCNGVLLVDEDDRRYCWSCGRFADPLPDPISKHVVDAAQQARNRALFGDTQKKHRGRPRLADVAERKRVAEEAYQAGLQRKKDKAAKARERRYQASHCVSKGYAQKHNVIC